MPGPRPGPRRGSGSELPAAGPPRRPPATPLLVPLTTGLAAAALDGRPLPPPVRGLAWLAAADDWPTDDAAVLLARVALVGDPPALGAEPGTGQWLVALPRDTGALVVGHCGVRAWSAAGDEVEIGYGLAGSARGRGLATSAVGRLVGLLLDRSGVEAVSARTAEDNAASRRLLDRLGFAEQSAPGRNGEVTYRRGR